MAVESIHTSKIKIILNDLQEKIMDCSVISQFYTGLVQTLHLFIINPHPIPVTD